MRNCPQRSAQKSKGMKWQSQVSARRLEVAAAAAAAAAVAAAVVVVVAAVVVVAVAVVVVIIVVVVVVVLLLVVVVVPVELAVTVAPVAVEAARPSPSCATA